MEISVTPGQGRGDRRGFKAAIGGAMTIYSAAQAKDALLLALEGAGAELEVDLSEVLELDTSGVQLLALVQREATAAGKRMVLVARSPAVMEVLDGYGLAARFGSSADFNEPVDSTGHERKR